MNILEVRRGHNAGSIKKDFQDHLDFTLVCNRDEARLIDYYQTLAYTIRDRLIDRLTATREAHRRQRVKRVYYLSLEYLMGRVLISNILNLGLMEPVTQALAELGLDLSSLEDMEPDMGLGNGGLGRLAACFVDSLATMEIPAIGYGIRYNYGMFRQVLRKGSQVEHPDDWLKWGNPWEIPRPWNYPVHFGGELKTWSDGGVKKYRWTGTRTVLGRPYDIPIAGFGGKTVNILRLWSAHAAEDFDFEDFDKGDYVQAVEHKVLAENLTKVLYPNDRHTKGKLLRLQQQYLFVSCSLQDLIRRFKVEGGDWDSFPERNAIQLNDTHPSLAVPELMRLLMDVEGLSWDRAWQLTEASLAYTNHTLLPEALEKWPVSLLKSLLPRHLQIIYEINQRLLDRVLVAYPGDMQRVARMSCIDESGEKQVRMAHLAIAGTHSVNGVAKIHTELLKSRVVPDFAAFFPEKFNCKTNGISQRRWLLQANPRLAALIGEAIGSEWIVDLTRLRKLEPLAADADFRRRFRQVKQENKAALAEFMKAAWGFEANPEHLFDVQVKRIHEYKRQLMNALHIVMLYNRLRSQPATAFNPCVFLFGGKAAPGYDLAKLNIRLINDIAAKINREGGIRERLRLYFLPNYRVSLAERMIPAADLSEQISTAGTEASGTGNMKFMLNGALTIGTHDGANIEMADEVGAENMFLFGLKADEVANLRPHYEPMAIYREQEEVRAALDLVFAGHFCPDEPDRYDAIRRSLLEAGDYYMVLADLQAYATTFRHALECYQDEEEWTRRAIINVASSGRFSSDRTIGAYAEEIWRVAPCPIP